MAEKSISKERRKPPEHVSTEKLLFGWEEIMEYFQNKYSIHTMKRWMRKEGFPVARLPDSTPVTDPELIRRWIWLRWQHRWGIKNLREAIGDADEN